MRINNTELVDEEISIEGLENIFNEPPQTEEAEQEIADVLEEETLVADAPEDVLGYGDAPKEKEEVEVPEIKDTTKKVEKPEPKVTEDTSVKDRVKELIELGILEDVRVSTSEDDEEGVLLSEHDSLTKDQIRNIINIQKEAKDKEMSESYIPKDNLSDHHLKIIEIMKNGGDLSQVFQDPNQAIKRPFEGKDLNDIAVQREVAMTYYTTQKNHSQKEAMALIQQKEKDFELDTFAGDIVQAYNQAYDGYLDKVKQDKVKEQQEAKKLLAERKKDLVEAFKEKGIKENVYSSVINGVTKPLEDGKLQVHKALEEILMNPKENYDVLLHLLDKKAYKSIHNLNTQEKATEQVLKLFDALPKDKTNQRKVENKEFASEIEEEIANIRL